MFSQGNFGSTHDCSLDWVCMSLFVTRLSGQQYVLLPHYASLDLISVGINHTVSLSSRAQQWRRLSFGSSTQ